MKGCDSKSTKSASIKRGCHLGISGTVLLQRKDWEDGVKNGR